MWDIVLNAGARMSESAALERLGWALVHSLWQVAAIAALLAVGLGLARRPGVRYLLACGALFASLAVPVGTWWMMGPAERAANETRPALPRVVQVARGEAVRGEGEAAGLPAAEMSSRVDWVALAVPMLATVWLGAIGVMAAMQVGGHWRLSRLARRGEALALPAGVQERLCRVMGVGRRVRLRVVAAFESPVAVGFVWPAVLVPPSVLAGLSPRELEAILLHELAHVRRHDYLVNAIAQVVETLLFYHPGARWIGAVIRREREHCCDDLAAVACGEARVYAGALARLEELRVGAGPWLAAAAGGALLPRIRRLLEPRAARRSMGRPLSAGLMLLVVLGLVAAGGWWPRAAVAGAQGQSVPTTQLAGAEGMPEDLPVSKVMAEDLEPGEPAEYLLQPRDVVRVVVSGLTGPGSETAREGEISARGMLSLPLLEPLRVMGLTASGAEKAIAEAYEKAKVGRFPVTVVVLAARENVFSILGAVQASGEYLIQRQPMRLYDALALARGTTERAGKWVVVMRMGEGQRRRLVLPIERLLNGDPSVDIVIRPGDRIYVPAERGDRGGPRPEAGAMSGVGAGAGTAKGMEVGGNAGVKVAPVEGDTRPARVEGNFYSVGGVGVRQPGAYSMGAGEAEITLRQALLAAGVDAGASGEVRVMVITRGGSGQEEVRHYSMAEVFEGPRGVAVRPGMVILLYSPEGQVPAARP